MPILAKCARCKAIFPRGDLPVCPECWPQESSDYGRVREVLSLRAGLTVPELASVAEVTLDVVTRMLDGDRITGFQPEEAPTCGKCGAPALSHSKRLCQGCLIKLDQACAEAIRDLRAHMRGFATAGAHQVHRALSAKRNGRTGRRFDLVSSTQTTGAASYGGDTRMAAPLNRGGRLGRSAKPRN